MPASRNDRPPPSTEEAVLIGVLDEIKVGREKLFKHSQLMTLLMSEQHSVPSYPS